MGTTARPFVVCLLPARNCAAELPGYFESARRFANAIIALDDGSTDETAAVLEAEPLVQILLRNPRRGSYAGWDDGANRNQLLSAADALEPQWIISMDADERLDASDARALLRFLETQAIPGYGYSMHSYTIVDEHSSFDASVVWLGKMFAWEPGLRFPSDRLHFVALPTSIPAGHTRTSLRLQHLGDMDPDHRRQRFAKYLQADPACRYQSSYLNLLMPRLRPWPWWERSDHLPVLPNQPDPRPPELRSAAVDLSVVIVGRGARGGATGAFGRRVPPLSIRRSARRSARRSFERALASVADQAQGMAIETIVVMDQRDPRLNRARAAFPAVRFLETTATATASTVFSAALEAASGTYLVLIGPDEELAPGYLKECLAAHQLGYALVSPVVRNGTGRSVGRAEYFLDDFANLPGQPSGRMSEPPRRCSYLRLCLQELGPLPEDLAGNLPGVNRILFNRGYGAFRAPEMTLVRHSKTTLGPLLAQQFAEGRRAGGALVDSARSQVTLPYRDLQQYFRHGLGRRLDLLSQATWHDEQTRRHFLRVRPLVALGALSWWLGGGYGIAQRIPVVLGRHRQARRTAQEIMDERRSQGERGRRANGE